MAKAISLLLPVYVTLMWGLVFLFQRKTPSSANKTLGVFMLMASLLYCSHAIFFHQFYEMYSFVESLYILALLSLYPLFYAYVQLLSTEEIRPKSYAFHFVPALTLSLVSLILTFAISPDQRVNYVKVLLIEQNLKDIDLRTIIGIKGAVFLFARMVFIAHVIIYLLLGIRLANRHNKRVSEFYSNTEGRKMSWVRDISFIIIFVSFLGIFFSIVGRSYFSKHEISLLVPSLLFSTIYFLIGFYGNQQLISSEQLIENKTETPEEEELVSNAQRKILQKKLLALFEDEKIYRLSDLRITTISDNLQTNRTYISKIINDEFGMNFNEFVNRYRVEEAEALLKSKDNNVYTLEYIAEQSGFGSTNSFARAFKEQKGETPGTFRNKYLHSEV